MKTYRKNKRALAAGALLPLLALLALAGAPHVLAKDATADITYTQQELARLVEQGCGEGRQADFGPVEANAGAFASLPEGAVLAEGVRAGTAQASWLRTLLDGKQHLSTTLAEAGYAAYTAYDLANHQLYIACANLTGEAKQLYLEVEQRGSMPYEAVSYRLAPVLEAAPETPEDVPPPEDAFPKGESEPTEPPESDPEHSPAGLSEDESTSILPAESDSAGPGAADTPAIEAQPEDPPASGSQAKEPIEETEDAPADAAPAKAPPAEQASAIISGFAPEEAARTGGADAKGPLVLSLPANGMGYIRFETGLLYGGSLAPSSRTRAALSTVSLATGSASPAEGAPGLLRLYSAQDPLPGGGEAGGDWATYSGSGYGVWYTVNTETVVAPSQTSTANATFTIELHNSQPVTLARVDSSAATSANGSLVFTAVAAGGPTLRLATDAESALRFHRSLSCNGAGTVTTAGGSYGLYTSYSGASLAVNAGFTLEALGATSGVRGTTNLNILGPGTLRAATAGSGTALYTSGTLALTDITLEAGTAATGIESNQLTAGAAKVTASGSAKGIRVNDDLTLTNAAQLHARCDAGGTAAEVGDEVVARGLSLLKAGGGAIGLSCDDLRSYDGSQEYGTGASEADPGKTRVVASGTETGIRASSDNEIGSGTVVIATGGGTGYYGEHFTLGTAASRRYGTLIAHGTGDEGIGLHHGARFKYITYGIRVVAVGGRYGVYCPGSYDYIVRYNSQLVAIGGEAGVNISNPFWSDDGSTTYARGGSCGIKTTRSFVTNYSGTAGTIVAIGGVDDDVMEPSPYLDTGYLLNNPFEIEDLPRPVPNEKGVLPLKAGTYGICTLNGGEKIESENGGAMYAYGGEWGAFSGTTLEVSSASRMELYGGRVGGQASTYMWFYASNNYFKACGAEYGLYSGTNVDLNSGSNNYHYTYGQTNALYATTTLSLATNSYLVAETVADGTPGLAANDPLAQPAIYCARSSASITIPNGAIVHELYTVQNYDISTLPPFAINAQIAAVGANMGTNPATLLRLDWTTPQIPPAKAADGRDYLNYDATDDQRLIKAGTAGGVTGLIAYGSMQNATLVGQSSVSARDMVSGGANNTISASSGTTSTYRVTLQLVNVEDLSTMDVSLHLREGMEDAVFALGGVPASLAYEHSFQSVLSSQAPQTIELSGDNFIDAEGKTILLPRLREGNYRLRPLADIGWPYEALPEICFRIVTDTSASVPQGGNYGAYWTKKLELLAFTCEGGATHAHLADSGSALPGGGAAAPAFPPPDAKYNVQAFAQGAIELIYRRLPYQLDIKLLDAESYEQLPGALTMAPSYGGQPVPGLAESTTLTNGGTAEGPHWQAVTVYAGLSYTFAQASVGLEGYIPAGGSQTVTVAQSGGSPVLDAADPLNDAYLIQSDTKEPYLSLWVLNDLPTAEVSLSLLDADDFEAVPQLLSLLPGGGFRLQVRYRDGTTADITDTALQDNGDGSFTLLLKPQRDSYYLTQTLAPPDPKPIKTKDYQRRRSVNRFSLANVDYGTLGGAPAITGYSLNFISASGDDGGWAEPENYDGKSIWITNLSPALIGALTVEVNATGLWQGHGGAVFIAEVRSAGGAGGKVYSQSLVLTGSGGAQGYATATQTGTVTFDPLPLGEYTVTVYPSLRTGSAPQSASCAASAVSEVTASFDFAALNSAYLSGEDSLTNRFTVEDAAIP